jgi:hypothetical protein
MDFDIAARNGVCVAASWIIPRASHQLRSVASQTRKGIQMSKAEDNKAIVGRWFTEFWGKTCNLGVVDELAAPDMLLQYSLHEPRRGRDEALRDPYVRTQRTPTTYLPRADPMLAR